MRTCVRVHRYSEARSARGDRGVDVLQRGAPAARTCAPPAATTRRCASTPSAIWRHPDRPLRPLARSVCSSPRREPTPARGVPRRSSSTTAAARSSGGSSRRGSRRAAASCAASASAGAAARCRLILDHVNGVARRQPAREPADRVPELRRDARHALRAEQAAAHRARRAAATCSGRSAPASSATARSACWHDVATRLPRDRAGDARCERPSLRAAASPTCAS